MRKKAKNVGNELMDSLREAVIFARGKASLRETRIAIAPADTKAVRKKLAMTQERSRLPSE